MKAKLIKRGENNYKLYVNEATFATTDNSPYKRLSLKNCQAIENGYDLGDLVKHYVFCKYWGTCRIEQAYADGFNQALKILGDKKFSEGNMKNIYEKGYSAGRSELNSRESDKIKYDYIQSLQPTEWDVTFNPDEKDSDGCLILKRIEL